MTSSAQVYTQAFLNKRHHHASDEFQRNRDEQETVSSSVRVSSLTTLYRPLLLCNLMPLTKIFKRKWAKRGASYSATVILHPWYKEASNPEQRHVSHDLGVGLQGSCKPVLT